MKNRLTLNRDQTRLYLPDGGVMDVEGLGHFYDVPLSWVWGIHKVNLEVLLDVHFLEQKGFPVYDIIIELIILNLPDGKSF